jgi:HD superfamily phosphohydrolase
VDFEVVRDPLWNNIRVDRDALAVLDTPAVQRLRYVRQLGYAYLVYPGATHTRFEHALGTYHLARRALAALDERGVAELVTPDERIGVRLAALLHDVGHYPFSHALEEAGLPHHEQLAERHLRSRELSELLEEVAGSEAVETILALIEGRSTGALAGLISGSLDLDKIEYLTRDAWMCGVPYGSVDVDRLIASLTLVEDAATGRQTIGVLEKGLSALESLLFAKYQMFRNVYWHHAVRAATCMFKRLTRNAIAQGTLTSDAIAQTTDDRLLHDLTRQDATGLATDLRRRRLHKRALDYPVAGLGSTGSWLSEDPSLLAAVEDAVAVEAGGSPGDVLIDLPVKPRMLSVDLPLRRRDGVVVHLTDEGAAGHLGLPRVAEELYQSAQRYRVFVRRALELDHDAMAALAVLPRSEVQSRLARGMALSR